MDSGYELHCPVLVDRSNCIVSHGNCLERFLRSLVRVLNSSWHCMRTRNSGNALIGEVGLSYRKVGVGWLWGREIGFYDMLVHVR